MVTKVGTLLGPNISSINHIISVICQVSPSPRVPGAIIRGCGRTVWSVAISCHYMYLVPAGLWRRQLSGRGRGRPPAQLSAAASLSTAAAAVWRRWSASAAASSAPAWPAAPHGRGSRPSGAHAASHQSQRPSSPETRRRPSAVTSAAMAAPRVRHWSAQCSNSCSNGSCRPDILAQRQGCGFIYFSGCTDTPMKGRSSVETSPRFF